MLGASILVVVLSWGTFALSAHSLVGLALGTLLLDIGIQAAQISNQARIYALQPDARSRLNAFYMTAYFLGGAAGSLIAGLAWSRLGWTGAVLAGSVLSIVAGFVHIVHVRWPSGWTNVTGKASAAVGSGAYVAGRGPCAFQLREQRRHASRKPRASFSSNVPSRGGVPLLSLTSSWTFRT